MGVLRNIIDILLVAFLIASIFYLGYYIYNSIPGDSKILKIAGYDPGVQGPVNASDKVEQFYPNLRFNHNNISYFINSDCSNRKMQGVLNAFSILENETKIISFYSVYESNADILIECTDKDNQKEQNVFIAGEGGPTKILNLSFYPVILSGKILLYNESLCDYPVTELHELLHVFGFDHINDSKKIMFPYVDCKQKLNPELISIIHDLYSIKPLAELYFTNVSAIKTGIYLNFSLEIKNDGMINAKNVALEVYSESNKVDSFDLRDIDFGSGKQFEVSNLKLPSRNTNNIEFRIFYPQEEYNKQNNIIELEI